MKLPHPLDPHGRAPRNPIDVCARLGPLLLPDRRARIDEAAASRLGGLRLVIENLHDPHNGAAVLRSAEAFGIQRVDVITASSRFGSRDGHAGLRKVAGCGSSQDDGRGVRGARAEGFAVYATVPGADWTVEDLDFSRPAVVMVGNEHDGLSAEAIAAADVRFGIPMAGMTRSLNLSVAAALVSERAAARRRAAIGRAGDLDEAAVLALRARFYAASVRGADIVLAAGDVGCRPHAQRDDASVTPTETAAV